MRKLFGYLFLALLLVSCDTWLAEKPRSSITPDQLYSSDEGAIQGLNGVYAYLDYFPGSRAYWEVMSGTDIIVAPSRYDPPHVRYTLSPSRPGRNMPILWRVAYKAIGAANMAINRARQSNISPEVKDRVIGEASFLRAYYYFQMTKIWGGVPLWTDEVNQGISLEEIGTLPRASVEEVRTQIAEDLEEAASLLPVSYGASNVGRATKGAAQALLAKVYLFMEDWQSARDAALAVVNSGTYRLLSDYGDVFALNNEHNDEIIFSLQREQDVSPGYRHSWYEPDDLVEDVPIFDGYGLFLPTHWYVESFEEGDERKDDIIISQWNGQELNRFAYFGTKFFDLEASIGNSGRNFIVMRYADVLLMLAEAQNELDGPDSAYQWINQVRTRASLDPLEGLTQEEFRQAVRMERAHELGGEGHRRWDLNRWGTLVEAVKKVEEDNARGAANVQQHHKLFPIPPSELTKNPNLTQNPGY